MRIAFLEVVQRAVHEVLAHLRPGALVAQVIGRARTVDGLDRQRAHRVRGGLIRPDASDLIAYRAQEHLFEPAAQVQQRWIPFPSRVDSVESAVVQLVADVEGQLQIQAVGICFAERDFHRSAMQGGATSQYIQHRRRQRAHRLRQRGYDRSWSECHAACDSPHHGGSNDVQQKKTDTPANSRSRSRLTQGGCV